MGLKRLNSAQLGTKAALIRARQVEQGLKAALCRVLRTNEVQWGPEGLKGIMPCGTVRFLPRDHVQLRYYPDGRVGLLLLNTSINEFCLHSVI